MAKEGFISSELLSHVTMKSGGYSRPHHFAALISPPSVLKSMFGNEHLRRVSLNCSATALMGRHFASVDQDTGGQVIRKMPHSVIYGELPCRFYLSSDLLEKKFFDAWQDLILDPSTGNLNYYDLYRGTVSLVKHSRVHNNSDSEKYNYIEAYPIIVGDVQQDYASFNEISTLDVTFAYWIWERENTTSEDQLILQRMRNRLDEINSQMRDTDRRNTLNRVIT